MAAAIGALANELALLASAKRDPAAFAAVYDHYFTGVYNYVRYRVQEPAQAEDLTAQIFERVLGALDHYQPQHAPFAVWLFTIARNCVTDHLRSKQRRRWFSLDTLHEQSGGTLPLDEVMIRDEMQDALSQALTELNDRERDLLALKFVAQMTNRSIATLTGLSESNVGVILFRALQRLRTNLSGQGIDESGI